MGDEDGELCVLSSSEAGLQRSQGVRIGTEARTWDIREGEGGGWQRTRCEATDRGALGTRAVRGAVAAGGESSPLVRVKCWEPRRRSRRSSY